MSIKQFNGEWVCREDRVLFRFNTTDDREFSFWLTRFVLKNLIQGAQQLAVKTLEKEHSPQVAQALQSFQQQAVAQQANFQETYQAPTQKPLGDQPVLVTGLVINQNGEQTSVQFQLITQKNITVQMSPSVMQVMLTLLNKLQETAQWDVGFEASDAQESSLPKPASSSLMH
jgi:hypothetical protein